MPRNSEHVSLSQALGKFLNSYKLREGVDEVEIQSIWKIIMGRDISNYTTSIKLKNQTLTVTILSSVVREELSYTKEKIIQSLNKRLGRKVVKKLVIR